MTTSLQLPQAIYEAILAHAREGKPEEICGLLRGQDGVVTGIHRARNVAPNPITDYEVDPAALLVQFDWEEEGEEMIAIYHSHPADPAYPSASDAFNAHYPDAVYLICSLEDEARPDLQGFFLRPVSGEIDLEAARRELNLYETRPNRWAAYIPAGEPSPPSLSALKRPQELALYVVYETAEESRPAPRPVSVEPVALKIEPS